MRGTAGTAVLAQPRVEWPRRRSSRNTCTASSRERHRVARSGRGRVVPQADERVAGAGRRQRRLHRAARRADRPLRPPARRGDPGRPLFFATAMTLGGVATGPAGRKPRGPADQGRRQPGSSGQPRRDRSLRAGVGADALRPRSIAVDPAARRDSSVERVHHGDSRGSVGASRDKGAGLRILTETVASPTLAAQMQQVLAAHPRRSGFSGSRCPRRDNARAGARLAFGQYRRPGLRLHEGRRRGVARRGLPVVGRRRATLRYARSSPSRRSSRREPRPLNRLYVVEATPSVTGTNADHRIPLKASYIESFARALRRVGAAGAGAPTGRAAGDRRLRRCDRAGPVGASRHARSCWPARRSRPRFTRWRTRSTRRSATSARR